MAPADKPSLGDAIEKIDLNDQSNWEDEVRGAHADISENLRKFVNRNEFLSAAGKLAEKEIEVEDIGWVIVSELTADERADVIGKQATMLNSKNELDVKSYQRSMLMYGLVDPESPPGKRTKMLRPGDVNEMMRIGGGKLQILIDAIERLSAMGRHSELAEGNSETTLNGAPTSK